MGKGRSPWQDGRRAWERLKEWAQEGRIPKPGDEPEGSAALAALTDVGLLRHLLDQVELTAVRTARRSGRSWAEIATKLGVTRQTAWERWRELDEPAGEAARRRTARVAMEAVATELVSAMEADMVGGRAGVFVRVPDVVGLAWDVAVAALIESRLVGVGPDPDGPPLAHEAVASGVVVVQKPGAGARVEPGSSVTLWIERGDGGAGDREPRRPSPMPKSGHAMRRAPVQNP